MKYRSDLHIEEVEGVYSPDDDTFLMIDLIDIEEGEDVLEIGCGSGIISVYCGLEGGEVTAVDKDEKALELTRKNAFYNDVRLEEVRKSDLFSELVGVWDVIIFNPPYLPKDERLEKDDRWDGGERGDETILRFLEQAVNYVYPDGRVYFCCSDKSPMVDIYRSIESYYDTVEQKERTYDFETLYVFELSPLQDHYEFLT
ncbi:MAG: HemK2/MTQ2 family protein methyltransferase [Thermoplasmatota archaeon]